MSNNKRLRVYVAGPYSTGEGIINWLDNIRNGVQLGYRVLKRGHLPFVPFLDFLFALIGGEMTIEEYQRYSMGWLDACDVLVCLEGWEKSAGTRAELCRAKGIGVSVFWSEAELMAFLDKHDRLNAGV